MKTIDLSHRRNNFAISLKLLLLFTTLLFFSCSKDTEDAPTDDGQTNIDDDPTIELSIINIETQSGDGILDFGSVYPNFRTVSKLFTVSNQSSVPISVSAITGIPNGFTLSEPFSAFVLNAFESKVLLLDFHPLVVGDYGGTITINSDADEGTSSFEVIAESATTTLDSDGNEYNIVRIGNQLWLLENFRGTKYLDGTEITHSSFSDPTLDAVYGKFYPRDAIIPWDSSLDRPSPKKLIKGFSVPTNNDWNTLFNHLGGTDVAGGKMKHAGTEYWDAPNTGATNSSGFTALPSGSYFQGEILNFGNGAKFWSYKASEPAIFDYLYSTILLSGLTEVLFQGDNNPSHYSVRLIKR